MDVEALTHRTVLLTAMKEEQQWLLARAKQVERVPEMAGLYQAKLGGVPVLLARCGVGKVNAALSCALLQRWQPRRLILLGSAAALQPTLQVGDFVLAHQLAYHDADLTAFGYAPGQLPTSPPFFSSQTELCDLCSQLLSQQAQPWQQGLVVSGDQFIHHQSEYLPRLRRLFPQAAAVEMESAAVAHACQRLGWPLLVLRVISDSLCQPTSNAQQFAEFLAGPVGKQVGLMAEQLVSRLE